MAIAFACSETSGFNMLGSSVLEYTGGASYYNTARSRAALQQNTTARATVPDVLSSFRLKFLRRSGTWTSTGAMFTLYTAAGVGIIRMFKTSSTAWRLDYWDGAAWQVASTTVPYNTNLVVPMEFKVVTGVGGSVEIYSNDVLVESWPIGDVTGSLKYIDFTLLGGTGTTAHREVFSEVIIADTSRSLQNVVVETEAPTGNGADVDGTGTCLDVDEAVNDQGGTVVNLSAAGMRRSFTAPARTATHESGNILAVTVAADLRMADDGGPTKARFYLVIGGTRYYGPTWTLTNSLMGYQHAWNTDPSTGAAWTKAAAEAASLAWGVEAVA